MAAQQACAACWHRNRPCVPVGAARCKYCTEHAGNNLTFIISSGPFPEEGIRLSLLLLGPSPNLDAEDLEEIVFSITTANNQQPISTSIYTGQANTRNALLMGPLNRGMRDEFTAPLDVQAGAVNLVGEARIAGAWLHMFCIARIVEQVQEQLDGEAVDTVQQLWVEAQFRALALSRIAELISAVIRAVRGAHGVAERRNAHVAAVILRYEITTFMKALLLYPDLVPTATSKLIRDWLAAVSNELHDLICHACGDIQAWEGVILSSRKEFRAYRRKEVPVTMRLTVSRNKSSVPIGDAPPPPPPPALGLMGLPPPVNGRDPPVEFPTSPPPTTTIITPSESEWDMLENGLVDPSWLSLQSDFVPPFYPGDLFPISPTVDTEVNMGEFRADPRYRNHLVYCGEDGVDSDPDQHPPVVVEDDEDLLDDDVLFRDYINYPDDSPTR